MTTANWCVAVSAIWPPAPAFHRKSTGRLQVHQDLQQQVLIQSQHGPRGKVLDHFYSMPCNGSGIHAQSVLQEILDAH